MAAVRIDSEILEVILYTHIAYSLLFMANVFVKYTRHIVNIILSYLRVNKTPLSGTDLWPLWSTT